MKLALCIGINDYPGTHMDLAGCVNDAKDWAAELKKRGFKVQMLLNKKATGKAIRTAIRTLMAASGAGDTLVVQFSGHGSFVPDRDGDEDDGTDECICPHDVERNGVIDDDELFTLYSARHHDSRLFIISDSCHSGSVARFSPIKTPPTTKAAHSPQRMVKFMPPQVFLSQREMKELGVRRTIRKSSAPGRYAGLLLAGCQDVEYSFDAYFRGRPNGAFTYVALQTLKKLKPKATYSDWYKAIRKALPSQQYAQTPTLFGASSMKRWKVLA